MKLPEIFCAIALVVLGSISIAPVGAQTLWKYTDKDGKVTYSDRAPKTGEKAEPVATNPSANIIDAPRAKPATGAKADDTKPGASEAEKQRESLRKLWEAAKGELEKAKKDLADGREPTDEERQIVVGRDAKGNPTGVNTIVRKQSYYERIASLEEAVRKAQTRADVTEENLRRGSDSK
jgi:hypothetical protein